MRSSRLPCPEGVTVNASKLDALARTLSRGANRRQIVAALTIGVLTGLADSGPASAKKRCRKEGHPCEGSRTCCDNLVCERGGPGAARRCTCPDGTVASNGSCRCPERGTCDDSNLTCGPYSAPFDTGTACCADRSPNGSCCFGGIDQAGASDVVETYVGCYEAEACGGAGSGMCAVQQFCTADGCREVCGVCIPDGCGNCRTADGELGCTREVDGVLGCVAL